MILETNLTLPKKSLFKIEEVAELTGVRAYVIRFWESEFSQINPVSSSSGQKLYEPQDVELIYYIKQLMFEKKLAIERAKLEVHKLFLQAEAEAVGDLRVGADGDNIALASGSGSGSYQKILTDLETQKLILAKAKIESILLSISSVKQNYQWI